MLKLLLRKCLQGLMMILIVSVVTFALLGLAGGDALTELRNNPQISEQTVERLRSVYGLDKPLPARYFTWLTGALTGDMGDSIYFRVPVSGLVWSRFLNTFALGGASLLIAVIVSFSLSVTAARYRSKVLSTLIDGVVFITASTPRIVLALLALAISVQITSAGIDVSSASLFWLAAVALAAPLISMFLAQFHGELDRTMNEDFIQLRS